MIEEYENVIAYGGRPDDADKVEPGLLRVVEAFRATARSRRDLQTPYGDGSEVAATGRALALIEMAGDPSSLPPWLTEEEIGTLVDGEKERDYTPPSVQDIANARRSVQRTLRAAAKRVTQGEPMDTRTGEVAAMQTFEKELSRVDIERYVRPIDPANLTPRAQAALRTSGRAQISRNSPCPCGSRKRFKRCHMTTP